jgi:magnesium transporter
MAVLRTVLHDVSGEFQESIDPESISELIPDERNVLWLDIQDPTKGDFELLRREFDFHELALEDVVARHQRAKIDEYPDYYFVVFYALSPGESREINLFIGDNYLVTVHHGEVPEIGEMVDRWCKNADRIERGVGVLVYSLLDAVVDGYFPVVDEIAERVEVIEEQIFSAGRRDFLGEVFALKKELLNIRRCLGPGRDVLNVLIRRDQPILGEHTLIYFQDVYDHTLRVLETIDLYRDQLSSLLDAHLSVVSNRLNYVMKRMTALATILMSVTLIAGIYGMNFRYMPELEWQYGYAFALGAIAAVGTALALLFRKFDWL